MSFADELRSTNLNIENERIKNWHLQQGIQLYIDILKKACTGANSTNKRSISIYCISWSDDGYCETGYIEQLPTVQSYIEKARKFNKDYYYKGSSIHSASTGKYETQLYGRISGGNAATPKNDNWDGSVMEGKTPYQRIIEPAVFEVAENQYLGKGNGKGQVPMTVRVTMDGKDITNVEILEDYETPGLTDRAKEQVIAQIIERDEARVDIVSGCTMTSAGIMEAVGDALAQAQ